MSRPTRWSSEGLQRVSRAAYEPLPRRFSLTLSRAALLHAKNLARVPRAKRVIEQVIPFMHNEVFPGQRGRRPSPHRGYRR